MTKLYLFLADGFEEVEALTVVDLLRRAKLEVTTVSISDKKEVTGSHQITVLADQLFSETNVNDAKMLILPGGMPGTKHLSEHAGLVKKIIEFNQENKKLAAICAAPSVFGMNGILEGKKATCYPSFESKLEGAKVVSDRVVKDGNIITSRALGTAIEFSLAIIEELLGKQNAEDIKSSILF